jgi:hypothetical protein
MSNETDAQRLAAALEQLTAERQRREDERVSAGEAVRVPLAVVSTGDEDIDTVIASLKSREIERLRASGEGRAIIFEEPTIIVTGVPRRAGGAVEWKDEKFRPFADRYATPGKPPAAPRKPPAADPAALVWKPFRLTASPPDERSCGVIIEARYAISDGELIVAFQGKQYAQSLGPNDDELAAARKLLKQKYAAHGEFNAPINYAPRTFH